MAPTTDSDSSTAEPLIRFRAARKEFASGAVAVEGLDLDVLPHELLALVGPSGCGKSTTLRMVNRLVEPSSGQVLLEGEDVMSVDAVALRRRIGYVIQHVGLFPHRTVTQNVTTVPRLLGWDKRRAAARVEELLDLVGLDPATYGRRYPHELSGGERQRVGVARALAVDPPVLLMDEPFGAVDPEGRRRLQVEFRRIQQTLGTTVMLVTHDIDEAVSLADRVVVLSRGGVVEQVADPVTLLARPANAFVEQFIGTGRETRLLGFGRVERRDLEAVDGGFGLVKDGAAAGSVALGASLDDALAALSGAGPAGVTVVDDGGAVVGRLTADGLLAALRRVTSPS
ncbi:ABC transporter ATP-binding protein [Sanguibacter suaedae]|uniref:ABC-type quaternary amine transporter n=1 Tax=Sanguibacter suaedae TaxID=2795737 RepID=A0A934I8Y0_9MICO|nr:ABC transporter ATP-binding protein [Sanguibacter suaedae]MBI9113400.1 ABC transporter ATP-binding protein [Sanguibacter suaedae]